MMALTDKGSTEGMSGGPRAWLRLEGAGLLALCAVLYAATDQSWGWFAALFLLPDLAFIAYAGGRRAGTTAYNMAHSEIGPMILGLLGWAGIPELVPLALIWGAHVGWDRMLGYGLKYGSSFDHTHLGFIGKAAKAARRARSDLQDGARVGSMG